MDDINGNDQCFVMRKREGYVSFADFKAIPLVNAPSDGGNLYGGELAVNGKRFVDLYNDIHIFLDIYEAVNRFKINNVHIGITSNSIMIEFLQDNEKFKEWKPFNGYGNGPVHCCFMDSYVGYNNFRIYDLTNKKWVNQQADTLISSIYKYNRSDTDPVLFVALETSISYK